MIFLRIDDWLPADRNEKNTFEPTQADMEGIEKTANGFMNAIENAAKRSTASLVVLFCPPSTSLLKNEVYKGFIQNIETELKEKLNRMSGVYPLTSSEILKCYPVTEYYEPMGESVGHIPYTEDFFVAVSTMASRKIFNLYAKPFKAVVVDCDNTLWTGVVGEDGVLGVKIDEQKKWFQRFLIRQYESGMLVCLCSKNVEADVNEAFEH